MTDFFAVFGLARHPSIDRAQLHATYLHKSEALHRNAAQGDLSTLNAAFKTLDQVPARLVHLLELTFGYGGTGRPGHRIGQLFSEVATGLQSFDALFSQTQGQNSLILRAAKVAQLRECLPKLDALQDDLAELKEGLEARLAQMNEPWDADPDSCRDELEKITTDLVFACKWLSQVQERRLRFAELF